MPSSKLKSRRRKRVAPEGVLTSFMMRIFAEAILGTHQKVSEYTKPEPVTTIDIPYEDVTHKRIEG